MILSGLELLTKSIRDFLFTSGACNLRVVSPIWLMTGPKTSDEDLQQKLDCLWLDDPVHPVELGYVILLAGLKRLATVC